VGLGFNQVGALLPEPHLQFILLCLFLDVGISQTICLDWPKTVMDISLHLQSSYF
jgi:hypothetical protein